MAKGYTGVCPRDMTNAAVLGESATTVILLPGCYADILSYKLVALLPWSKTNCAKVEGSSAGQLCFYKLWNTSEAG